MFAIAMAKMRMAPSDCGMSWNSSTAFSMAFSRQKCLFPARQRGAHRDE